MVVVTTRDGRLAGRCEDGVNVWRGIPYAAAPTGPLRFRAPQPVAPWRDVRDAQAFGAAPPQPPNLAERVLGLTGHGPMDEDCLFLNVWSQGPGGPLRPVMVWLHGGGFVSGSGSDPLYDGARFAARGDVVVVTLSYRLGPLGFLHLFDPEGGEADVNLGLRDQIAALVWVRDNIAAFGGDPAAVTLFGQSAGAMGIATLLGTTDARALVRRAILQSGAAAHVHDRATAEKITRACLAALRLGRPDMAALRALSVEALVAACGRMAARASLTALPFESVVDGALVAEQPLEAVRGGAAAGIPLLLSTTRDEFALYTVVASQDPTPHLAKRWRKLRAIAGLAAALGPQRLGRLAGIYRAQSEDGTALAGDLVFRQPAIALAEAQGPHAPVFMARFDWASPAYDGQLGACHAVDVPFVWTMLDHPAARTIGRDGPAERALAQTMQDAWIAFAHTGTPAAAALPDWPPYEPDRRATMILDTVSRLEDDPRRAQRLAWV